MSLEQFMHDAISPWMKEDGPDNDIVLSTRIRLARNIKNHIFPTRAKEESLITLADKFNEQYFVTFFKDKDKEAYNFIKMSDLSSVEKRVLVEKHLISPYLANAKAGAAIVSKDERLSIMINEEDHLRIQLYFPGQNLIKALTETFKYDDLLEEKISYAYDEEKGYLTSCPTNVGTGLRASVMIHLPALVMTKKIQRMIPTINQFGFVVRGIYGEGSEAIGDVFQISNQITLGKSEKEIVVELENIIHQLIEQERWARNILLKQSSMMLEDQIYRSYGLLKHSRVMEWKEAAQRISTMQLGIDLGIIKHIKNSILNELMILTQPGLLQYYAKKVLTTNERDILRATLIRERLSLEESKGDE